MVGQLLLHLIEQSPVYDCRLLPGQNFSLVFDLANKEAVAKKVRERSSPEWNATSRLAGAESPHLCVDFAFPKIARKFVDPADFEIPPKDQPDAFGLLVHNEKLAVLQFITQGQGASDPEPFPFGRRDLVPDALRGDLALELSKGL